MYTLYTKTKKIGGKPAKKLAGLHHGVGTRVWCAPVTLTTIYLWGIHVYTHTYIHTRMCVCIYMYTHVYTFWKKFAAGRPKKKVAGQKKKVGYTMVCARWYGVALSRYTPIGHAFVQKYIHMHIYISIYI